MSNINGGNKKMKKIFSNENIRNIRLYVNHEIMNQGGKDKKDISKCRFIHTERVALISYQEEIFQNFQDFS